MMIFFCMVDMLEDLFEKQGDFDDTVQGDPRLPKWDDEEPYLEGQRRINALLNFMISESEEAKEALGFLKNDQVKWWKNKIKWDDVFEETIDMLHVILSIWRNMGKNAKDVHEKYIKKWTINFQRQENGY